jgi:hypothetical protein
VTGVGVTGVGVAGVGLGALGVARLGPVGGGVARLGLRLPGVRRATGLGTVRVDRAARQRGAAGDGGQHRGERGESRGRTHQPTTS